MNLERVLSMKGGKGEDSYHNNSEAQGKHARSMLHLLSEALDGVRLRSAEDAFAVADLGCSSGGNTINTMGFIIKHMTQRYEAAGYLQPPEFSAFFCDLPSNDFNTLFQLLPPFSAAKIPSYFTTAVPGSFHRRLFPAKYVDFFYSAFSLHWLSQDDAMGLVLSAANVRGWTTGSGMEGPPVPAGNDSVTERVSTFPWSLFTKSPRRRMRVAFTCNVCGQRTTRAINPHAYTDGTVFVQCCGCNVFHKLVDNLNLFHEMKCYVSSNFNPNPNDNMNIKYLDMDEDNNNDDIFPSY